VSLCVCACVCVCVCVCVRACVFDVSVCGRVSVVFARGGEGWRRRHHARIYVREGPRI
jgi:hypothetical protein